MGRIVDYEDYLEADWHIFPLYPIVGGKCGCENPDCIAVGKHPLMASWQLVTTWDDAQIAHWTGEDGIRDTNSFLDGFGVNLTGLHLLVLDVDARNGGVESLRRMSADLGFDVVERAGFVVRTGSGNGSLHIYMRIPETWHHVALRYSLDCYPGIDFKSSGFVVGCGSLHASGDRYWKLKGSPGDTLDAPVEVLELLKRPEQIRSTFSGKAVEYSFAELENIVRGIKSGKADYEQWLRVGMGIHHATDGSDQGEALWDEWSADADNYTPEQISIKWHSFGKSPQSQITIGTLVMLAKEDGYSAPVSFENSDPSLTIDGNSKGVTSLSSVASVNLKRPPGLVGQITAWINSRSMYPRENLAVGAALMAVSNAAGLRYRVAGFEASLNLIVLGVADSGSGKGSILGSLQELHRVIGIQQATHGGIKSEQELIRNQLRHQAALYLIDEVGSFLSKVSNSKKSGRTAYLEHVVGVLMSLYSATNDYYNVTGDLKEEMEENVQRDIARLQKRIDGGLEGQDDNLAALLEELSNVRNGVKHPFMSFYGVSEPGSFNEAVNGDLWLTTGGFVGRSIIFTENDGVPVRKRLGEFGSHELPAPIAMQLATLYWAGEAGDSDQRVKAKSGRAYIKMSEEAIEAEEEIYNYWHEIGRLEQDSGTGMQALTIRATELTIKVAGILGVAGGVITLEHMQWAFALVHRTTMEKIARAKANKGADSKDQQERSDGVVEAVKSVLAQQDEFTVGVVANRFTGRYTREQIQECLDWLVSNKAVSAEERKAKNGRKFIYYKLLE